MSTHQSRKPVCHIYIRVSHLDSLKGASLDRQQSDGIDYYRRVLEPQGVELGQVFEDRAVSAFKTHLFKRPAGADLNRVLAPGDHVVFLRLDRAFRSIKDFANTHGVWRSRGVNVHFINPAMDLSTANGRLIANIIASIVQWESEMMSERQRELFSYRQVNMPLKPRSPRVAPFFSRSGIGKMSQLAPNQARFEEAMVGMRMLSEGKGAIEISQTLERMRCSSDGIPYRVAQGHRCFWTRKKVYDLPEQLMRNMMAIKLIYGERPELYLAVLHTSKDTVYHENANRQGKAIQYNPLKGRRRKNKSGG